ncbi:MAG: hypothetical protein AB8B56_01840 [Crocinitomicaceae bacterium]
MKKILLSFALIFVSFTSLFAQQDTQKIAANFKFTWNDHLLPNSSFLVYHGKNESYFLDSTGNRVPEHSYLDIKTGGFSHFIVQTKEGYHVLDTQLGLVTKKAYDEIKLITRYDLKLSKDETVQYLIWSSDKEEYVFSDALTDRPPMIPPKIEEISTKLGKVQDSRFKSKRIERLRFGIDMSQTLTVGQKGKNVLIKKGEKIVYKGPTKPMLFYDFAITGSKGPHSIYHPISKDPILENCDLFWFVDSYLVVSVKGSPRKYIISNTGEIILSSAGEIRHYNYTFGGRKYAFFCDGRSVVNLAGDLVYKSDGELIGVGEHYIYSGYKGAYLGDLTHTVKLDCSSFARYQNITIGQTGRNQYRVYDAKSILVNKVNDYYIDKADSVVVCAGDSKIIICDPFSGKVKDVKPGKVEGRPSQNKEWKYFLTAVDETNTQLEGRFDATEGVIVSPKYLKIEWPESEKYHVVLTKEGLIRYLDSSGKELFD